MFIGGNAPVLTISFEDNNLKPSTAAWFLDATTTDLDVLITSANALRTAVLPLTNARITGASLTLGLDENAPAALPGPESEVERKLLLPFRGLKKVARYTSEVPSSVFTIEQTGTDNVDPANALVAAYIAAVLANARTNRGETLTLLDGVPYVDHRNRRRA